MLRVQGMSSAEKSLWNGLRKRLARATAAHGAKIALARLFGISDAAVAQWINGTAKPSAELTLRVLEWVTAFEAKQNKSARGGATNTTTSKTRSTQIKYEKRKTSPRRR